MDFVFKFSEKIYTFAKNPLSEVLEALIFPVRSINRRKAKLPFLQQNLCNQITENFNITPTQQNVDMLWAKKT